MQYTKTFRNSCWTRWIGCAVVIAILPIPSTLAQSQLSLQSLKRVSTENSDATPAPQAASIPPLSLIPLPEPQVASATEVPITPPTAPPEPKFLGVHTLSIRQLPPANNANAPTGVVRSLHSQSPENFVANVSLPVAILSTYQAQEPKEGLAELSKDFHDVNQLIGPSFNPQSMFKELQTDRKYLESATVVEPTRMQKNADSAPYLWNAHGYAWESATFCFSPLYFEQPNLERYGQGIGRPFASSVSAVKFVADVTTLPIAVICTPPWDCSCTLGHHRPGNCAPYQGKSTNH